MCFTGTLIFMIAVLLSVALARPGREFHFAFPKCYEVVASVNLTMLIANPNPDHSAVVNIENPRPSFANRTLTIPPSDFKQVCSLYF